MVAVRSSSSSSSTSSSSSSSALLLRVVLLSACTALLLGPANGATVTAAAAAADASTDVRREQTRGSLQQLDAVEQKPVMQQTVDGGVPVVDSFYVDFVKDNGRNNRKKASQGDGSFRSLQEGEEHEGMMTVAPTSAPTAAPTASPSAAPTAFSTPAVTSGTGSSWRSPSSSRQFTAAGMVSMVAVVVAAAALAGMA